jgi:hypothetical protein
LDLEYIDISPSSTLIKQYQLCLCNTSHVYILINLFDLCQHFFLHCYIYFVKCWHMLNDICFHTRLNCITISRIVEFEDIKGVIRIRVSKKNIQHNGQMKKYKRTNNDLKKHTHRTKDRITRTPLKTGDEPRCFGRVCSSCSISGTRRRVNLVTNPVISHQ